ncbi:RNA 3'-terminal phosphate cyclase [Natrialba swarupiae]|uniref:RNA 3'-terminal phosphate cyclase n=1 Tax=Natrialba swarupiae TaxID=2448032 RepID=A0A5D5AL81_9EURY|nr:RNA 3'-terminal phosphate cyclase [Natrialba swarupiae]TYT62519.1 RNA 3'-terminal phosphate cyclase [Natrialba swarupiae]
MSTARTLDGSSAGGQFLRTALGLSVVTGDPITVENVRGDRPDPGLGHQHLAVLETMTDVCDADTSGDELGSETVEFDPGRSSDGGSLPIDSGESHLEGGHYRVDIGTAGSVTLLFDALLPLAAVLESPLSVTATGGTDVKWSPPIEYLRSVKLPLLRRFGLVAACEVDRRGFYPAGGGRARLSLGPSRLEPLDLRERGQFEGIRLYSTEAAALADSDVASRQIDGALDRLSSAGVGADIDPGGDPIDPLERRETTAASDSPGSAIVIRIDHGTGRAGVSALGERGTPAERIGARAASDAVTFVDEAAPIDRHLADQLMMVLALAGGAIRIPTITDHVAGSRELLEAFDVPVAIERDGTGPRIAVRTRE